MWVIPPLPSFLAQQRFVAKNAYGCSAPAKRSGAQTGQNPGRSFRQPATVMQKQCAQRREFIARDDEHFIAQCTAALPL
jgi:hypothetical protein